MKNYLNRIKKLEAKILERFGDEEAFQKWMSDHPLSKYGSYLKLYNISPYEHKGKVLLLYLSEELSKEKVSN